MNARTLGLVTALSALACGPREDRANGRIVEQGRTYTAWLYGNEYDKLWERFSPEMRQSFGSASDLASFAGRALKHLGAEGEVVEEQVNKSEKFLVYSRAASFNKAEHPVLIEWSLAPDGKVTGLVVRPAPNVTKK